MNRRSILAAYKKKSSHFQTGVTGFKSGNLFKEGIEAAIAKVCGVSADHDLVTRVAAEYKTIKG